MIMLLKNWEVYINKKPLIKPFNLELKAGEFTALVGPNGAGKSTLLKSLMQLNGETKGEFYLDTHAMHEADFYELTSNISYMSQFGDVPSLSVYETLELGRRQKSRTLTKEDKKVINEMIEELNLQAWLSRSLSTLSGGERQKVMIAVALLQEPKLLLLDEPISHLDPKNQSEMLRFVKQKTVEKNIITLVVLHDMHHALHYANRMIMLRKGEFLGSITPHEVDAATMSNLFDVPVTLHKIDGHMFLYYGHHHGNESKYNHHQH